MIARRLLLMDKLSFLNRMYLFYFSVDSLFGLLEAFSFLKLKKEL